MIKDPDQIKTQLFVISPNNSGSTFLKNVLATSLHTWNLPREGQHMFGFIGPLRSIGEGKIPPLLWASEQRFVDMFLDPANFDWPRNTRAWYMQAFARDERATVFVEKSPPAVLYAPALGQAFPHARFLFMVRNPYAVIESVCRRPRIATFLDQSIGVATRGARHILKAFAFQKRNLETLGQRGVFFTYEEMCARPEEVEGKIKNLVPALDDLVLSQRISVKGLYDEALRDMNADHIGRLTRAQVEEANRVFMEAPELLEYFGYSLLDPMALSS